MNKCKCAILLLRSILFTPDIVFRRESNVISVGASFKNPSILFAVYFIKCGDISHWNRWKVENEASTFGGRRDGVSGKPLIENKKRIIRSDEIDIFTKRSSFFSVTKREMWNYGSAQCTNCYLKFISVELFPSSSHNFWLGQMSKIIFRAHHPNQQKSLYSTGCGHFFDSSSLYFGP